MNESNLRSLLLDLAESGGDPDETAAWGAITESIEADRARRRRRWMTGVSAVAAGAAAATLAVVALAPNGDQALDAGPADGATTSTAPAPVTTASSQIGTAVTLPADPYVIVGPDGSVLHVMDTLTGERVSTPISGLAGDERVMEAVMTPAGDIFFVLQLTESSVLARTTWDGDGFEVVPASGLTGGEGSGFHAVAVDRAGARLAYSITNWDGQEMTTGLGILDLATGESRTVSWLDGEVPAGSQPQELSFSPDGSSLLFVAVEDTDGTEAFSLFELDLSSDSMDDLRVVDDEVWDATYAGDGSIVAVAGPTIDDRQVVVLVGTAPVGPGVTGVVDLEASATRLIARTQDSWFTDDGLGGWVPVGFGDWTG